MAKLVKHRVSQYCELTGHGWQQILLKPIQLCISGGDRIFHSLKEMMIIEMLTTISLKHSLVTASDIASLLLTSNARGFSFERNCDINDKDVDINDKDASKPVARNFNLPNHSQKHMVVCGLSLHLGNTETRKKT